MIKAGLGFNREMKICITHMHGDHILGLPGLIQTMSLLCRTRTLEIYGPAGLGDFIEAIEKTIKFTLTFRLEVIEIEDEGLVCAEDEYEIIAARADHVAPAFAYSLEEKSRPGKFYPEKAKALGIPEGVAWAKLQHGTTVKLPNGRVVEPQEVLGPPRSGRKISYSGDSRFSEALVKLAKNADLLIHDCTFDDGLAKRAAEDGHSIPSQVAKTAKKANVKRVILTHISARYKTPNLLLNQTRKGFINAVVAEDFMKIDLPLHDVK